MGLQSPYIILYIDYIKIDLIKLYLGDDIMMKNYFVFLTFSFLTTTTFAHAGKNFDIFKDWHNSEKLTAKQKRLDKKIKDTPPSEYSQELNKKLLIIEDLNDSRTRIINDTIIRDWLRANEKISEIKKTKKANFIEEMKE